MAFGSDRSANFVIAAKDAATKPLGNIGKAMGRLQSAAGTAFKAIGGAAIAATAAIAAFTAAAIKGAIEDERSTILTNAALEARGFELDKIGPKIDEQIKAMARLGKTDDDVRAGLEVGSRFFKNQTKLLQANEAAAAISAVTGRDMASVMSLIGKAANGSTRGLAALIGPIEKGASVTDILTQSNEKYLEVANALADSTSGKMLTAQIGFNEAMEKFGYQFLPLITEALTFLAEEALPAFSGLLDTVGPILMDLVDNFVRPLIDSVAELFSMFEGSEGSISILELALLPLQVALTAIKTVIDAIIFGLKLLGFVSDVDIAAGQAATNSFRAGERDSISAAGTRGGSSEGVTVQNTITFGNDATSFVNTSLGSTTTLTSPSRTRIR
jgi:hypothetical protein